MGEFEVDQEVDDGTATDGERQEHPRQVERPTRMYTIVQKAIDVIGQREMVPLATRGEGNTRQH